MKEFSNAQSVCIKCGAEIGTVGCDYIRTIDAPSMGYDRRVKIVEVGCAKCDFEWREIYDPEDRIVRSDHDHTLADYGVR